MRGRNQAKWRRPKRVLPALATAGIQLALILPAGLCLTSAASAGQLSPADKYVECVERAASESASRHVGDPVVARSTVPAKVLSILAGEDVLRACGSLADAADDDDITKARSGAYDATQAAINKVLSDSPPPLHPPTPGSDDYSYSEKLEPGAWERLSIECRALLDWGKYAAPASCVEDAREANRVYKDQEQAKEKTIAALPSAQYCLGLEYDTMPGKTMPEKTESVVNEALRRIQAMSDEEFRHLSDCSLRVRTADSPIVQYCLGLKRAAFKNLKSPFDAINDEILIEAAAGERLRAMGGDDLAKVGACEKRVEVAGGLVAIDPVGEMERINRIPAVQDAQKQYSDCVIGRAVQMARVSAEPAETIARAALGGCALLRQQYLAVVARELDIVMTPERAAEEEKETTGALVGHVIAARAAQKGAGGQ